MAHDTLYTNCLFFLVIASCFPFTRPSQVRDDNSTEFIRTSCNATTYPHVCFSSLSSYASTIQSNQTHLAQAALSVSLAGARSTSDMMGSLSSRRGLGRREISAMKDCAEVMGDAVEELNQSIREMKNFSEGNVGLKKNDIQTWVSAALTDENTCMDGFEGLQGQIGAAVRGKIVNVVQLTSNALALINKLST